jgi:hypothetical protein
MNICPKCNAIIEEDEDFCPECGEDITLYDEEEITSGFEPEILYMADNLAEAQAITEFLRDNNIGATYIDHTSPLRYLTSMRPSSANSIPIMVPEDRLDEAHDMLEEYMAAVPDIGDSWKSDDVDDEDEEDEELIATDGGFELEDEEAEEEEEK